MTIPKRPATSPLLQQFGTCFQIFQGRKTEWLLHLLGLDTGNLYQFLWGQTFGAIFFLDCLTCSIHIGVHISANCRTAFSQCLGGGIKDIVTYLSPWCSVTHCSSQRGATEFAKLVNSNRWNLWYILVYIYIYVCVIIYDISPVFKCNGLTPIAYSLVVYTWMAL